MTRPKNLKKKLLIAFTSLVFFGLLAYGVRLVMRTRELYSAAKSGFRGWNGRVHESDPEMGLRVIPGARAGETFPTGPDVPTRISREGFRIPVDADEDAPKKHPLVLALGCSWTFGAACVAEDTFSYLTADALHGTALNAGLCSGGSAQMLVIARRVIPQYKPEIVLVQYSPWLMERSQRDFAPTYMGRIPTATFVETDHGVELEPPLFGTLAFDLPIAEYKSTPRGFLDFLGFEFRVGAPLLVHDDLNERWIELKRFFGAPKHASAEAIEALVYPELKRLCDANGARMVIVAVDAGALNEEWHESALIAGLGVPIAHGTQRMRESLPNLNRKTYVEAYQHMRGDPPVVVDSHPNPRAHRVIADAILEALR